MIHYTLSALMAALIIALVVMFWYFPEEMIIGAVFVLCVTSFVISRHHTRYRKWN
jgi:hypothetical protein